MLTFVKKEFITFKSKSTGAQAWGLAQGLRREIGSGFDCMASNTWQDAQSMSIHSPSPHQKSPGCSRTRPDTARLGHVQLPFPSTRPSRPPRENISVSNVHLSDHLKRCCCRRRRTSSSRPMLLRARLPSRLLPTVFAPCRPSPCLRRYSESAGPAAQGPPRPQPTDQVSQAVASAPNSHRGHCGRCH